jgi:holin-like protein
MLFYLTLIFSCQLAGEFIVVTSGISMPGPVVGMLLLFCGLLIRGSIPKELDAAANALLAHLSLLFVPAGVGIMLHAHLVAEQLLPIGVSLVVSTVLTIAVTGSLMAWLGPGNAPRPDNEAEGKD